jgi:lipoprotein NlpI
LAKQRIAEIDQTQSSEHTADVILERGLLKAKVLRQTDQAMSDFTNVLQLSGGDPQLLTLAGVQFSGAKRFGEAKQFFDRAFETAKGEPW